MTETQRFTNWIKLYNLAVVTYTLLWGAWSVPIY